MVGMAHQGKWKKSISHVWVWFHFTINLLFFSDREFFLQFVVLCSFCPLESLNIPLPHRSHWTIFACHLIDPVITIWLTWLLTNIIVSWVANGERIVFSKGADGPEGDTITNVWYWLCVGVSSSATEHLHSSPLLQAVVCRGLCCTSGSVLCLAWSCKWSRAEISFNLNVSWKESGNDDQRQFFWDGRISLLKDFTTQFKIILLIIFLLSNIQIIQSSGFKNYCKYFL